MFLYNLIKLKYTVYCTYVGIRRHGNNVNHGDDMRRGSQACHINDWRHAVVFHLYLVHSATKYWYINLIHSMQRTCSGPLMYESQFKWKIWIFSNVQARR